LRAVVLRAVVLRAAVFFFAAAFFLVPDFFADDFFAVDFFRDEERELERELERDDDLVVAGTVTARSAPSLVSAASADSSLKEPAFNVCDVSPVPPQSSWVINDLLVGLRVHDSLPRCFLTCNADSMNPSARC
jgi:hypothetical protein